MMWYRDVPGGPAVKNLPCNEGDMGSIPGQGTKIPPAATTEPVGHNERVLAPSNKFGKEALDWTSRSGDLIWD